MYIVRMHLRTITLSIMSFILGAISIGIAYAWSGPTAAPPGNNPAHINIGDTYQDLGATAKDSAGHELGVITFLNGALVSNIVLDTTAAATDTIDYVATDTWGQTATATRTVIIEAPPNLAASTTESAATATQ